MYYSRFDFLKCFYISILHIKCMYIKSGGPIVIWLCFVILMKTSFAGDIRPWKHLLYHWILFLLHTSIQYILCDAVVQSGRQRSREKERLRSSSLKTDLNAIWLLAPFLHPCQAYSCVFEHQKQNSGNRNQDLVKNSRACFFS